ncbi:MAG: cupin domain-containing protein [Candidatus Eremiobacteraeota bacterium]|nr:cupin domain-containing protein [Candidatus Eremiobacteraeota bacterium]MBV8424621.1 cupin domain-containing protein [Candidatus Eremiobacteraeota bacterium]MBV8722630.1 cupin domain-containing protein [Candidatus Eremiobacteraeota bacterium]
MKNVSDARETFGVLETGGTAQTAAMRLKRGEESGPLGNEHAQSVQVLLVVRGAVTATVGDKTFRMGPGDSVVVEKGVAHRFVGASDEDAVTFNVYSPPAY